MFKRKGGGKVKGLLNNVKKKLHFSLMSASLIVIDFLSHPSLSLRLEFGIKPELALTTLLDHSPNFSNNCSPHWIENIS